MFVIVVVELAFDVCPVLAIDVGVDVCGTPLDVVDANRTAVAGAAVEAIIEVLGVIDNAAALRRA